MKRSTRMVLSASAISCFGLGLIVITFVVVVVTGLIKAPEIFSSDSNSNDNYNSNRNSNFNSTANLNANTNTSRSSSTMSDDDKHRLLLAASAANDPELMRRVIRKLGFFEGTGDDYAQFIQEHATWAIRNREFYATINTPEKARAYINAHIDD